MYIALFYVQKKSRKIKLKAKCEANALQELEKSRSFSVNKKKINSVLPQ